MNEMVGGSRFNMIVVGGEVSLVVEVVEFF